MPISKSAKRALRTSERKASVNRHRKEILKDALKKVSEKTVNEAVSAIDKAAKNHTIHQNKAARLKSQLAKKFGTPKVTDKPAKPAAAKKAAPVKKAAPKKAAAKKTVTKTAAKK